MDAQYHLMDIVSFLRCIYSVNFLGNSKKGCIFNCQVYWGQCHKEGVYLNISGKPHMIKSKSLPPHGCYVETYPPHYFPQQILYFLPLPQGQGSFRPTLVRVARSITLVLILVEYLYILLIYKDLVLVINNAQYSFFTQPVQ